MDNIDEVLFEQQNFNVDTYVKSLTSKIIQVDELHKLKNGLNRTSEKTSEEIKLSVYNNYANFMETAKEIGHFEGKMSLLRQSLDEQRKLLGTLKNFNINISDSIAESNDKSNEPKQELFNHQKQKTKSLALILDEVENCSIVTQKPDRELLFHSDLEILNSADWSVSHKLHVYLLNDSILLALPQRKRNKISNSKVFEGRSYRFQALYELNDINASSVEDRKEAKNVFQVLKFPESFLFRCQNAHLKKEWLENLERAKKNINKEINVINEETEEINQEERERAEQEAKKRAKFIREQLSDFDIYLAQRDFEKAVDLLIRIRNIIDSLNEVTFKQKEIELINMLKKDLLLSKERGNKGILKTGKRVVSCLVKLQIYDEALNLFIDYHKTLNAESLKKIKLEESNAIYMNNVMNTFFDNLKLSFTSFKESFSIIINFSISTYLTWIESEIDILIRKLESQHYIGSQFELTIDNCELIFDRAHEFSQTNFEVKFLFETKLRPIIEKQIKAQKTLIIQASVGRLKFDDFIQQSLSTNTSKIDQNKQAQLQNLIKDLEYRQLFTDSPKDKKKFCLAKINFDLLSASTLQFSRSLINFIFELIRIYYQDINYSIIECLIEILKGELKKFEKTFKNIDASLGADKLKLFKKSILFNLKFIFETLLPIIESIYEDKTKVKAKNFVKLYEKYSKFVLENSGD
jgi:exocyst complex component 8